MRLGKLAIGILGAVIGVDGAPGSGGVAGTGQPQLPLPRIREDFAKQEGLVNSEIDGVHYPPLHDCVDRNMRRSFEFYQRALRWEQDSRASTKPAIVHNRAMLLPILKALGVMLSVHVSTIHIWNAQRMYHETQVNANMETCFPTRLPMKEPECAICYKELHWHDPASRVESAGACGHVLHTKCLATWHQTARRRRQRPTCPMCRGPWGQHRKRALQREMRKWASQPENFRPIRNNISFDEDSLYYHLEGTTSNGDFPRLPNYVDCPSDQAPHVSRGRRS